MATSSACVWTGVFPAATTQFDSALQVDLRATQRVHEALLHLDAGHDLVQSIKLAAQIMGRGTERVRPPRLMLAGERRAEVIAMVERAHDTHPR